LAVSGAQRQARQLRQQPLQPVQPLELLPRQPHPLVRPRQPLLRPLGWLARGWRDLWSSPWLGLAHGFADVHVGLRVAVVMAVAAATERQWMAVNRGHIAFEFGILASGAVDGELGFEDFAAVAGAAFGGFA
jgi:hypothetical protein